MVKHCVLRVVLTRIRMVSVCSSFHAMQYCESSGLRKFKRLAPNGRGLAIVPFYAVNISQMTALKKTQLLQQDLGLKNEDVLSQMLYQLCSIGICHIPPPKQICKTVHLQVVKNLFLQTVVQYSKREQHLRREKE